MVGLSSDEKKPPFSGWLRPHRAWGCPCGRGNKKARRSGHHLCNEKEISSETMRAASRFAAHGCGPQALACLHVLWGGPGAPIALAFHEMAEGLVLEGLLGGDAEGPPDHRD